MLKCNGDIIVVFKFSFGHDNDSCECQDMLIFFNNSIVTRLWAGLSRVQVPVGATDFSLVKE